MFASPHPNTPLQSPGGFDTSTSCSQRSFVFTFILNITSLSLISHPRSVEGTKRSELTFKASCQPPALPKADDTSLGNDLWTPNTPALLAITPLMVFALPEPA